MIPVIDVFAGPGGLGEGFSALRDSAGDPIFKIALSIEKDPVAHQTLRLRSFFRQFPDDSKPSEYFRQLKTGAVDWDALSKMFPDAAKKAEQEAWQAELGAAEFPAIQVDRKIRQALGKAKSWVLIGGPPCQVYSLVGRSRIRGESAWRFARDRRHLLYKEYLRIIGVHRPPVFVMENVKGLLSSKKAGKKIIEQIVEDLRNPLSTNRGPNSVSKHLDYSLYPLVKPDHQLDAKESAYRNPAEYIIRSEDYGIPRRDTRLILVGIRNDLKVGT